MTRGTAEDKSKKCTDVHINMYIWKEGIFGCSRMRRMGTGLVWSEGQAKMGKKKGYN